MKRVKSWHDYSLPERLALQKIGGLEHDARVLTAKFYRSAGELLCLMPQTEEDFLDELEQKAREEISTVKQGIEDILKQLDAIIANKEKYDVSLCSDQIKRIKQYDRHVTQAQKQFDVLYNSK